MLKKLKSFNNTKNLGRRRLLQTENIKSLKKKLILNAFTNTGFEKQVNKTKQQCINSKIF